MLKDSLAVYGTWEYISKLQTFITKALFRMITNKNRVSQTFKRNKTLFFFLERWMYFSHFDTA